MAIHLLAILFLTIALPLPDAQTLKLTIYCPVFRNIFGGNLAERGGNGSDRLNKWIFEENFDVPQQSSGSADCGVFCLYEPFCFLCQRIFSAILYTLSREMLEILFRFKNTLSSFNSSLGFRQMHLKLHPDKVAMLEIIYLVHLYNSIILL